MMDNEKKPEMNPELLKEGVAVCRKECGALSKETVPTDNGSEVKVKCALIDGKDKEIHPRPVCVPWSSLLLVTNASLSEKVVRLTDDLKTLHRVSEGTIDHLRKEISGMEKSGIEIRSELVQAKKKIELQAAEIAKLNEDVMVEDLNRQRSWEELKKVQNYRKGKKRHDERLARVMAENEKLKAKASSLEESNKRLTREDVSKANILEQLNRQISESLKKQAQEIEATAEYSEQEAAQPDAQ